MKFKPVNDEHSILTVGFGFTINREIDIEDIKLFAEPYKEISAKLPHQSIVNDNANFGVQFKYLRPDGSAIWFLSFINNIIEVQCTMYTRWEEIWQQSWDFMSIVATSLARNTSVEETRFGNLSLRVVDVFLASEERSLSDQLFIKNQYIAPETLKHSRAWNSDIGWFYDIGVDPVLNKLSISSKVDNKFKVQDDIETQWIYEISQYQEHRGDFLDSEKFCEIAPKVMVNFHDNNKIMLKNLLSDEAQKIIKLHGE